MNQYRFCPRCGNSLGDLSIDNHHRMVCGVCGFTMTSRPAVGVGVIVLEGQRVILGRRGRRGGRQYQGAWRIPCGYLEWGEDVRAAAQREFLEETGLQAEVQDVYAVHSNFHSPNSLTVGIWFQGTVVGGTMRAGDYLDLADYFPLDALPQPLAFPTDRLVLEQLRQELLTPPPDHSL